MPKCLSCGEHYRLSAFNETLTCEACIDFIADDEVDAATEIDIRYLKNPSGRTPAEYSESDPEDTDKVL